MKENLWLKLVQIRSDAGYNLITFPYAGGCAEFYLPWSSRIKGRLALYPIQLPGRSYRLSEAPYTHIDHLLSELLPIVKSILLEKPYYIFGHSMGGYIAYSFLKKIQFLRWPMPKKLFVSSIPAPVHWQQRRRLSEFSDNDFEELFLNLGGFHQEFLKHKEFIKLQMKLLREDILLCESCLCNTDTIFSMPIIALGATDDEYVPHNYLEAWQQETSDQFTMSTFTGGHFYLNIHQNKVIDLLCQDLKLSVYNHF